MTTAEHVRAGVRHPLEPLTAEEIEAASQILKQDRGLADSARFVYITLREPSKEAVRKDARWQEAMRRRGITDFDMVMIDPWSVGYNGPEDAASRTSGQGYGIRWSR